MGRLFIEVKVALVDEAQPLASVTVTVKKPATREVLSSVDGPSAQTYLYGEDPPVTVKFIEPFPGVGQEVLMMLVLKLNAGI